MFLILYMHPKINTDKVKEVTNHMNNDYGLLISINNKIIYEKYIGNHKNTKFRIFSLSKPITALAIFILAMQNKIKLSDPIDKYNIDIPYNNIITINHLLNHSSGVYDFSSELYFKLNPKKYFDTILDNKNNETHFIDFETFLININKNKPYHKPPKDFHKNNKYNNTGYDILGYIIYLASGIKTNDFIKTHIFNKLKMNDSYFQHNKNKDESIPYENNKKQGNDPRLGDELQQDRPVPSIKSQWSVDTLLQGLSLRVVFGIFFSGFNIRGFSTRLVP